MRFRVFCAFVGVVMSITAAAPGVSAQVMMLSGKVTLKQADGSVVPVAGAVVDIYRTDMKMKAELRTDKRGSFVHAGLPMIGTYTVAVSAPGARPDYRAGVRLTQQPELDFALVPGDGSRLTLEEIGPAAAPAPPRPVAESAEDKAKREEMMRKNAEIEAENKKITEVNAVIQRTFKAGNDALGAANIASRNKNPDEAIRKYTEAIAQYDEGLAADALQPAILTNKAVALKGRGVERFNAAVKLTDDAGKMKGLQLGKDDFKAAAEASGSAVTMIKAQAVPAEAEDAQRYNNNKYAAMLTYAESMRLYVSKGAGGDVQADAGAAAFRDYMAVEPDPAKRAKAHVDMAQMLLDAGAAEKALVEFRLILKENPDSPEANLGAGLAVYALGDKTRFIEAANYLQHFADVAPDSNPMKEDAKAILRELRDEGVIPARMPKPAQRPH